MSNQSLSAISPLDGRYSTHIQSLIPYYSEFALIKYRIRIEVEYLIALTELNLKNCPKLPSGSHNTLRKWVENFDLGQAESVKVIEKQINHDVKAVEYFVKQKLESEGLSAWTEFVHFGLTSQDINNTAIPLLMKESTESVLLPKILDLLAVIKDLGNSWINIPMLARTHGQAATPTRFGKELLVFSERIEKQLKLLNQVPYSAKFGGATGGFNAHLIAYSNVDWVAFGNIFVANLGLERSQFTTQIEHYDNLAAYMNGLERINTILIDFCRDIWQYISIDYLKQKINAGEVGSSAMPHKVNPIDFENAEGNLGIANALMHHFSSKLPISRLQRDLSDSTVLRNIGVPIGHCLVAYQSITKGMKKIELNTNWISEDLNAHIEVVSEAIQTILRRELYPQPYEALKKLSRTGQKLSLEDFQNFINQLDLSENVKAELLQIRPDNYIGVVPKV
jgi:adenylosuccinate lyase